MTTMLHVVAGMSILCSAKAPFPIETLAGEAPAPLEDGTHLFIDDAVVAAHANVTFTVHSPDKHPGNPIYGGKNPHTGLDKAAAPFTVMPLSEGEGLRMWYIPHSRSGLGYHMGYATSAGGISWDMPALGIVDFQGSTSNNLVVLHVIGGVVLVDPNAADPAERYKSIFYRHEPAPRGFSVAFSADGLHWSPLEWIEELDDSGDRQGTGASDIVNAFYDPVRQDFVAVFKMWSRKGEYTVPVKRGGPPETCARRIVGMSRSKDFRHWSRAKPVLRADSDDPPTLEFYGVPSIRRVGGLYLGFMPCLIDDAPPDGIGWTELVVSRDGENWRRIRQPFLQRSEDTPGAVDHAIAWVSEVHTVGDKEHVYYTGYVEGHKLGARVACLATLRKNGFVSVGAGSEKGSVKARPLSPQNLSGKRLSVNADASRGEVRVQLSVNGKPVPGYAFRDCGALKRNAVAVPVTWRGSPQLPDTEEPVQIQFQLRRARMFSFTVERDKP